MIGLTATSSLLKPVDKLSIIWFVLIFMIDTKFPYTYQNCYIEHIRCRTNRHPVGSAQPQPIMDAINNSLKDKIKSVALYEREAQRYFLDMCKE